MGNDLEGNGKPIRIPRRPPVEHRRHPDVEGRRDPIAGEWIPIRRHGSLLADGDEGSAGVSSGGPQPLTPTHYRQGRKAWMWCGRGPRGPGIHCGPTNSAAGVGGGILGTAVTPGGTLTGGGTTRTGAATVTGTSGWTAGGGQAGPGEPMRNPQPIPGPAPPTWRFQETGPASARGMAVDVRRSPRTVDLRVIR